MSQYHDLLEIPEDAPRHEIRAAYRRLAMKHHPDRGGDPDMFDRVQRAFRILYRKVCEQCNGAGFIEERNGAFVKQTPCPKCWKGI